MISNSAISRRGLTPDVVQLCKDGIYVVNPDGSRTKIAPPIRVTAFATAVLGSPQATAFTVVKFMDRWGKWQRRTIEASLLTSRRKEFITLLSNNGYSWPPQKTVWETIIAALSTVKPKREIKLTPVPGPCGDYFVLPSEAYGREGATRKPIELHKNDTVSLGEFRRAGTLKDWKEFVAKRCIHSSRARLAIAVNFAAPILRKLGINSFGFNFSGETSSGKTQLLRWAASVSGLNSDEGPATWDGTPAAFEQRALGHRDCMMPLDDISYLEDPRAVTKLVTFRLAGNRTKHKAGQYVRAHNLVEADWRVISLSTSEESAWDLLDKSGARVRGEEVRMMNVRADVSDMGDIFDGKRAGSSVGRTVEERRAFVDEQDALGRKNQGEAYRAYLPKWKMDPDADAKAQTYMTEYAAKAPILSPERWLGRIQKLFAVTYAGAALAIDYRILPWRKKKTLEAIKSCMYDAMDQLLARAAVRAGNQSATLRPDQSLLAEFKQRVEKAQFVRMRDRKKAKLSSKVLKKAGGIVRTTRPGFCEWLLFGKTMDDWFPDVSERQRLAKLLRGAHLIKAGRRSDTNTRQVKFAALGKKVSCYVLRRSRLRKHSIAA
jgi:putative DNA primase/helicase